MRTNIYIAVAVLFYTISLIWFIYKALNGVSTISLSIGLGFSITGLLISTYRLYNK